MSRSETQIEDAYAERKIARGWLKSAHDAVLAGRYRSGYWDSAVELAREAGFSEAEIPAKPRASKSS